MAERSVRRRRKAERPTEILQAALEEFSLKGFEAARLEDVAARAGITKGTIYVYFPSKEDLFVAALKEKTQPVMDHLQALAAEPQGSALDILRRHLAFVADHILEDPCGRDIIHILIGEGHRFPAVVDRWFADVMEPALHTIQDIVRRGIAQGEFRDSAIEEFPQLVMAPIILHSTWQGLFGDRRPIDVRRFFDVALDQLTHGLLKR